MTDYKVSQYTWLFESDSGSVLYNGYSGALARLEARNVDTIRDLMNGSRDLKSLPQKLLEQLRYGRFVVDKQFDERKVMAMKFGIQNFQLDWLAVTVVVTEECNFACPYCYQTSTQKQGVIDPHAIEGYFEYVEAAASNGIRRLMLTLYGGEPLIYPDTCHLLAGETKMIAEKNDITLRNTMVTNGYLLDENIEWMLDSEISSIQVTIDGPREIHNKRRPLRGGDKGTYDRIVENCREAAESGLSIVIRVNVEENVTRRLEDSRLRHENISVYYEPTRYDHCNNADKYYRNQDFMYNAIQNQRNHKFSADYLKMRIGGCLASAFNSFVLLPDGSVVKCWDEVGCDHERNLHISDDGFLTELYHNWIDWNPYLESSQCYICKLLPNCGGGCPYRALNATDSCCQISEDTLKRLVLQKLMSYDENDDCEQRQSG